MMNNKPKATNGQALVEFALMITVVLMLIFLIIEASRILWAWTTVQNAAREGARYAITGQFMGPECAVQDLPKFQHICQDVNQTKLRTAGIISVTHRGLSGLPLDETSGIMEDDNYYIIQVWGGMVTADGLQLVSDYGGLPGHPVVVRAMYRVPIITPFFNTIVPSVPVVGQVTEYNENFGQLGNPSGTGLPPSVPPVPTAGPSPTPTDTPPPDADPTETPTATPTNTWTPSPTPVICGTRFMQSPLQNQAFVLITGEVDEEVTLYNLSDGMAVLGTATLTNPGPNPVRACEGYTNFDNSLAPLVAGNILLIESANGTTDLRMVLAAEPTPTQTHTPTVTPTSTPTVEPTETMTPTPSNPFISVRPNCGPGPNVQFNVSGANWPPNSDIALYWNVSTLLLTIPASEHSGSFSRSIVRNNVGPGTYTLMAAAIGAGQATDLFTVPCSDTTPVPTTTATPTSTPNPADLIVVGPPELISTPPIVAYQPVQYRVVISNTGDIDVNQQFFVDLYLNPAEIFPIYIPVEHSSGYRAVGGLPGGASRVISITAPFGFQNEPTENWIYAMVDSLEQVPELIEDNNISTPAFYDQVTPAATPTPTFTPSPGGNFISGVVRLAETGTRQNRAQMALADAGGIIIRTTESDANGFYTFADVPDGVYTVYGCIPLDGGSAGGSRAGISVPPSNEFATVYLSLELPCLP